MNESALSLNKSRWILPDPDFSVVEKIMRAHDLPEIVARLLAVRGVALPDIAGFLHPTLKDHFPDPFTLKGMEAMALDVSEAIKAEKKFAIFGDFDVDGATSSALLHRFLKHCGIDAPIYIPGRLTEGYGPNIEALTQLKEQGADILFLLDCGTTAFDTVKAGTKLGLKIIIIDHHEAEDQLPDCWHMINPKRKDDESGLDMLAAVGVTFLACVAINNKMKGNAPLKNFLDIVALGTVCDMVPLTSANRLFVRHGFKVMNNSDNVGLRSLIEVSKINGELNPYHAGFVLGPRINAGSRVHKSDLGATLLSIDNAEEAKNIAWTLNDCNDKRKAIQQEMEATALNKVEDFGLDQHPVIFVDDKNFHQGLSGLVAGRLKEKYKKPAVLVSYTENNDGEIEGRGSGRSVPGIHIAQSFIDARNEGVIVKGGGHAMAGGFTVDPARVEDFKSFLYDHVSNQMQSGGADITTDIDALITVRGCRPDFIKMIHESVGPFGQGFEEPLFMLQNVRLHSADVVGDAHIRCMVSDWEGGTRMKAMAFRAVGTVLGEALLKNGPQPFNLVGTLKIDNWTGTDKVEMHIKDAMVL
ncbi:MAG: single-stranded-DNA-specific exonuclease RecJ [Micavibrio sp.]|nr:single-stranded-DNA-specific exonuclease RecJ [Micavibrio sp.]